MSRTFFIKQFSINLKVIIDFKMLKLKKKISRI